MEHIKSQRVFMNGKEIDAEMNIGKKLSLEDALESIEKLERIRDELDVLKSSLIAAKKEVRERAEFVYKNGPESDKCKLQDTLEYLAFKRLAMDDAEKSWALFGE